MLCEVSFLSFVQMWKVNVQAAMTSAQSRLADTIDVFYGSADRTSEGAMAANAYKRSVDELDASVNRELVRRLLRCLYDFFLSTLCISGSSIPDDDPRTCRQDVCILPNHQRHHLQEEQKG